MTRTVTIIVAIMFAFNYASCSPSEKQDGIPEQPGNNGNPPDTEEPVGNNDDDMKIQLIFGGHTFTATLEDNATAEVFRSMLPLTLVMDDVNGNEKYFRLDRDLPTSAFSPGTIRTGDIMLWGSNGLVLFYKTFSTSYNYTRLGCIDAPEGLESALGAGSLTVTFQSINNI